MSYLQDNTQRNSLKAYRKEIVVIAISSLSLLIFDLCERWVLYNMMLNLFPGGILLNLVLLGT